MSKATLHLADGVRLAIEDLTAQVSDLEGDTVGLACARWDEFVRDLVCNATVTDGIQLGQRLIGYRQLCFTLVMELARAEAVSPGEVMHAVGLWATTLET